MHRVVYGEFVQVNYMENLLLKNKNIPQQLIKVTVLSWQLILKDTKNLLKIYCILFLVSSVVLICQKRQGRLQGHEKTTTFDIKTNDKGYGYLVLSTTEQTKNWRGFSSSKAWDYCDVRAYDISVDQDSRPNLVDVYRFYLKKLHPDNDALFQKPNDINWQGANTWYHKTVIGVNKL